MKLNLRKTVVFMLAISMLVAVLTACGSSSTKDTPEPTAAPTQAAAKEEDKEPVATPEPTEIPRDLKGITVTVSDWWTTDPNAEPTNQRDEDTLAYREEMMQKYNFTITRANIGAWTEYQEIVVSSIMSGAPAADVMMMDYRFMSAPLQQGLLYPLNTLESFDFTEEKWNQQVLNLYAKDGDYYGMASGKPEPRLGVFWNKRLFEEAGINPDEPYDLQAKGEWTWQNFENLCKKLTRDINSDGVMDVYGISSFSVDFFRGCVFSNNAQFIGYKDGKYYNATSEPNFLEALEWGRGIYDKGYHMPKPETATEWNWFISTFLEGKVAMQCAEEYMVSTWKDMEDDWGFVMFPKGPKGEMMTLFTENVAIMAYNLEKEKAEDIAFAYNIYTNVTPGYENEDWKEPFYPVFRDTRAVDETLPLFYEPQHGTMSYLDVVPGIGYGDITYDLDAGAITPAEAVEKVQGLWTSFIDAANGEAAVTQ